MTEQEWLVCTNPENMLEFLRDKASERKLRLFAVACCREDMELMGNASNQLALEASEDYAEGRISRKELKAIRRTVWEALHDSDSKGCWEAAGSRTWEAVSATLWRLGSFSDKTRHSALLHDIFGNPFRPASLDPTWLAWHDGLLVSMARQMYESRDFTDMPVLADALEDAGCTDQDILGHLRGAGPHVRGCWVVDLCLGKF
jgi:hypothetical protein